MFVMDPLHLFNGLLSVPISLFMVMREERLGSVFKRLEETDFEVNLGSNYIYQIDVYLYVYLWLCPWTSPPFLLFSEEYL